MRIAIVGPPGTHKTHVGSQVAEIYDLKLVDSYLDDLKSTYDFALGPWSTYVEELTVAGYRYAHEQAAGDKLVTVGTIIDTITYSIFRGEVISGRSREEFEREYARTSSAMSALALYYTESWNYDYAFHLPYDGPDPDREPWKDNLDMLYRSVIEQFDPPNLFTIYDDPIEDIKAIVNATTTS